MINNAKNKKGFTLVEIMLVIAIIGVITTLAIPAYENVLMNGRDNKRTADIVLLQQTLEIYHRQEGTYPDTLTPGTQLIGTSTANIYLASIPTFPSDLDGDCASSTYNYVKIDDDTYILNFCLGGRTNNLIAGDKCVDQTGTYYNNNNCFTCGHPFVDLRDNQAYTTKLFGDQCWFTQNINIGQKIDNIGETSCIDYTPDQRAWYSCQTDPTKIEKYCYNNATSSCDSTGGLYEWAETMNLPYQCNWTTYTCAYNDKCVSAENPSLCNFPNPTIGHKIQGICPVGWHIPSNTEFNQLAATITNDPGCANGCQGIAYKLKSATNNIWNDSSDNSSGFSILRLGYRNADGAWQPQWTALWESAGAGANYPYFAGFPAFISGEGQYVWGNHLRTDGFNVRCIQD